MEKSKYSISAEVSKSNPYDQIDKQIKENLTTIDAQP